MTHRLRNITSIS